MIRKPIEQSRAVDIEATRVSLKVQTELKIESSEPIIEEPTKLKNEFSEPVGEASSIKNIESYKVSGMDIIASNNASLVSDAKVVDLDDEPIIVDDIDEEAAIDEDAEVITGDFDSFSDLRNYLFSGASTDYNKIYTDIAFQGGCQAAQNISELHIDDWQRVTKNQLLEELHNEYKRLRDGVSSNTSTTTETNGASKASGAQNNSSNSDLSECFASWEDLLSYLISGCYNDYKSLYDDVAFCGGSCDAVAIANKHKEDYATLTKAKAIEELHQAFLERKNSAPDFETWNDLYNYVMGGAGLDFKAKYDDVSFSGGSDIGKSIAEAHKHDYRAISKDKALEMLHEGFLERKQRKEELDIVGFFTSYSSLQDYLMGDATKDFKFLLYDVSYSVGSGAAEKVLQYHKDDWETVTKRQVLEELYVQIRLLYPESASYSGNYLEQYLFKDAKLDFEMKYPGVKFRGLCQEALDLAKKYEYLYYGLSSVSANRDKLLEELYNAYMNSNNSTDNFIRFGEESLWNCYTSYEEMRKDVCGFDAYRQFIRYFSPNLMSAGTFYSLAELVCEMHKYDYDNIDFTYFMSDLVNVYYRGYTNLSEISEYNDTEMIDNDPVEYYENAISSLIFRLQMAETDEDYRTIARQVNLLPMFVNNSSDKNAYIAEYAKTYGVSEESIRKLFDSDAYSQLEQKVKYILTICDAKLKLFGSGVNSAADIKVFGITISDGNIIFDDNIASINNGQKEGISSTYAHEYIEVVCERIRERLKYLAEHATNKTEVVAEIQQLLDTYNTLSQSINNFSNVNSIVEFMDDGILQGILGDNANANVVVQYIDNNYGSIIGDKDEFMNLVNSFYNGSNEYTYEDCAKLLLQILETYEEDEIPSAQEVAEFLAKALKMQDNDYENYKPLYEILESSMITYLDGSDSISTNGFIQYCKENGIFTNFRTQAQIEKDYCDTVDRLNNLLEQQIAIINKYNGEEPPEDTPDGRILADIKKQIEDNQYLLNKYCAETSQENAEETFRQYFAKIMCEISDTGLSEGEILQLLSVGTPLSAIIQYDDNGSSRRAQTRGAGSSNVGAKLSKITDKIHSFMSNISSSLGITRQVSSVINFEQGSELIGKFNEYVENGNNLINAYNNPEAACNNIVSWMGVSTSFVSAIFSGIKGNYDAAGKDVMVGFAYAMSPTLGGTIQNVVNIIKALNKYKENPAEYGKDWTNILNSDNQEKVSKMKLIFDISMNVVAAVGNFFTFGLLGVISTGLEAVQTMLTTCLGKIMLQIDKWANKLLGKPLTELMENLWKHSGLKKFWKKSGLQKLCKLLGLTNIWNKIFPKIDRDISVNFDYDGSGLQSIFGFMQLGTMDEQSLQAWIEENMARAYTTGADAEGTLLPGVDVLGNHSDPYSRGSDIVVDYITNGKKTGEVVTHSDGSKDYYEMNSKGELILIAHREVNGELVYISSGEDSDFEWWQEGSQHGSDMDGTGWMSQENGGPDPDQIWIDFANWAKSAGNESLANALMNWIANGCQGNFSWTTGTGGTGGTGGDSGWGGMGTNGGYAPDGTWNPIGTTGWGSIGNGVIGVGGHGGTPVLMSYGGGGASY